MSHATPDDVRKRLGRPLNPGEIDQITEYLEDAEAALLRKLPNLLSDAVTNPTLAQNLVAVECSIAQRAARLTDAIQSAYPNTESLQINPDTRRANVTVLDSEWRKVGLTWYSSFSLAQNMAGDPPVLAPGSYPDINPAWGPWWLYGVEY